MAQDTETALEYSFSDPRIEKGHVSLRCIREMPRNFALHAIVGGIRIGTYDSAGQPAPKVGDRIDLPCGYYPNKGLPNEMRFSLNSEDTDAAPAIALTSASQVLTLVGYDELSEGTLEVAEGRLRGTALNKSNAHRKFQPPLICRVNDQEMREVSLDAVTPHPGGGAWITFSAEIKPTDLFESGAHYEIMTLPGFGQVASKTYVPAPWSATQDARLAAVENAMDQLSRRVTHEIGLLRDARSGMRAEQRRLLDSFAEYMLSVIFDRVASGSADAPGSAEEEAAIAAFRQLVAAEDGETPTTAPAAMVTLPLPAIAAARGWYSVEARKQGAAFLWMSRVGNFANPYPDTPVSMISIAVQSAVSPDVLPMSALLDGKPAEVEVIPDLDTRPFRINLRPKDGASTPVHSVQLIAERALSPKDVGTSEDARKLSVAISSVSIHYDAGQSN